MNRTIFSDYCIVKAFLSIQKRGDGVIITSDMTENMLVEAYSSAVFKFCMSLCRDRDNANDLFQDTFLSAFRQMEKISNSDNPLGFLFSTAAFIARSRNRKLLRRSKIAPEVDYDELIDYPEDSVPIESRLIHTETINRVRQLVDELPHKLKVPIILYYTNEQSITEIASAMNIPEGTVKSRLYKARQIIEKGLDNEYET